MIGAVGHVILLVVGILVSVVAPGKVTSADLTLWTWLRTQRASAPEPINAPP